MLLSTAVTAEESQKAEGFNSHLVAFYLPEGLRSQQAALNSSYSTCS